MLESTRTSIAVKSVRKFIDDGVQEGSLRFVVDQVGHRVLDLLAFGSVGTDSDRECLRIVGVGGDVLKIRYRERPLR